MAPGSFNMLQFSHLQKITKGKIISAFQDRPIITLTIDSRKAVVNEGTLFFAINGDRNDGHQYIPDLYKKGIRQFIVSQDVDASLLIEANILRVKCSIDALQAIAVFHRSLFKFPVIGITGSNGKTIIKEWLYQILSPDYNIVKNPGSYNSQVGVPLSVWQMQSHHQLAIFESGISMPGEMEKLQRIIQPTLGLFTNIGTAHDEGFDSLSTKINEKLKLFTHVEKLIYCKDHKDVEIEINKLNIPALSWGFSEGADVNINKKQDHYEVIYNHKSFKISLRFTDQAFVENVFHCVTVMLHFGYSPEILQERINNLQSVPMRLELKEGINQSQVIDDTYNNDLGGLQISLDFLASQQQKKKKRLILSDILQSGLADEILVKKVADVVHKSQVNFFVGIGPALTKYQKYFSTPAAFYESIDAFLTQFQIEEIQQEIILIKGARRFKFEKIVAHLQKKVHGTVMEIDLGAMVHNLNFFKSKLNPGTKIMVMVKAFAYGSGSNEVASLLQYHKADYLGVAYADEGVDLRKNNITLPIMVMNPSEESFQSMQVYDLEPEIYSFKILHALLDFLNGKTCKVHLKLDTGMHRLGFEKSQLDELIDLLSANPHLHVASIFSHLAGADEPEHDEFSRQQSQSFIFAAEKISKALSHKPLLHILNSPGILRLPNLQMNMVRLGIGLYGVDPTSDKMGGHLIPVATLKTVISQIKTITPGETIGYGRKGRAEKAMTLATIAIGYADGFSRAFSRGIGEVVINSKRARVVGNVCMDMTMIDVTGIDAKEGDQVVVFGKSLPIQEIAHKINTIPYEILTSTSERVKRIFVSEGI
jgi:alanine racemase